MNERIAVYLTPEVVSRLKLQAPDGHVSKYVVWILCTKVKVAPERDVKIEGQFEKAVEYYRGEKMKRKSDKFEKGFDFSKDLAMDQVPSYPLLDQLSKGKRSYTRESADK